MKKLILMIPCSLQSKYEKGKKYAKIYDHNTYILFNINQAKEGGLQISSANLKLPQVRKFILLLFLLTNKAYDALIQICTQKNVYKDDFLHRFETEQCSIWKQFVDLRFAD